MQVFKWARIKLTALYLAIIMLITGSFSVGVYTILSREVERFGRAQRFRLERRLSPLVFDRPPFPADEPDLLLETRGRIALTLVIIDLGILLGAGFLGYLLAGRTLKPIGDMVEEQNRFVSDASHEFKTPLTSLKSSFEVFLRDDKATLEDAKIIIKDGIQDVDKLNSLATSLLDLAQFDQPVRITSFTHVELDEVVGKAIEVIKPLAQTNRIRINFQESHLKVTGDKDKLTQLVTILLDNAVKYSLADKTVDVAVIGTESRTVQLKVTDYGMGIAVKDLPHVFDRFYRAEPSRTKHKIDGYGLGLAIAKSIVESHGGKMALTSEVGKGTTVWVTL